MNSSTNRIDWPDELVDDIARRRSVIYLGAGFPLLRRTKKANRHPLGMNFCGKL